MNAKMLLLILAHSLASKKENTQAQQMQETKTTKISPQIQLTLLFKGAYPLHGLLEKRLKTKILMRMH